MTNSLDNLELLKEKMAGGNEDMMSQLNLWEEEIKKQSRLSELGKNEVVKLVIVQLKAMVSDINATLRDDKECDRNSLFDQRNCWHWLINLIDGADQSLAQINKEIENNLNN